jgi:hypothetical protein
MSTIVYGASDDLIEFEGDCNGEVGAYGTDDADQGVLLVFSDGTLIEAKYGKGGKGIWAMTLLQRGDLFQKIHQCADEDAETHSDVVHFSDGKLSAYSATEWESVR